MRRFLRSRCQAWWAIVLCSLAAIAVFMIFEVLDLDGSSLHARIFQPPLSSQPAVAESENAIRYGTFASYATAPHPQASFVVQAAPLSRFGTSAIPGVTLKRCLLRRRSLFGGRRADLSCTPSLDEPPRCLARSL